MAEEMELPTMPGNRRDPDPEEWHAEFQGRKLTKEQALAQLKSLQSRKEKQKYSSQDPETRTDAEIAAEACVSAISQLSPMKPEKLVDEPFDANEAFDKKVNELRAKVESKRSG